MGKWAGTRYTGAGNNEDNTNPFVPPSFPPPLPLPSKTVGHGEIVVCSVYTRKSGEYTTVDEIADLTISVLINGNWWTLHLPFPIFENQRFVKDSIPLESEFWDSIPNYQIIIKLSIYPKLFKSLNRILLNVDFFFHPRFSIERSKSLNNFFVFFFFLSKAEGGGG